jgi:hypothetical protein
MKASSKKRKRTVRPKLHPFKRWAKRDIAPLLRAGAMMSNICYNKAQDTTLDVNVRAAMKQSCTAWDDALSKLPIWMRK